MQADGKIVAAGATDNGADHDFALVRYKPTGALNAAFGTGGIVTTDFTDDGINRSFALARYLP